LTGRYYAKTGRFFEKSWRDCNAGHKGLQGVWFARSGTTSLVAAGIAAINSTIFTDNAFRPCFIK